MENLETKFKNPPRSFGGLDLDMINDALEDDVLREQIREFYDKGCYSVIARTYNGLKSDYPGESFMSKMAVILVPAGHAGRCRNGGRHLQTGHRRKDGRLPGWHLQECLQWRWCR